MKIGVIGGSGIKVSNLFNPERHVQMKTPFGDPSDKVAVGTLGNIQIFYIPRHGEKHTLPPSAINYRANIWCLKALGCNHVIATTATSSLRDKIRPGDLIMLSSFINRTTRREGSFFNGELAVGHVPMQPAFCEKMNKIFLNACQNENFPCHESGTVITVDGPRLPSLAESALYHSWNADVINMTTLPEVCLAKELAMLYVCIASVTDYCHWNHQRTNMGIRSVIKIFEGNSNKVSDLIKKALPLIERENWEEEIRDLEKTVEKSTYKKGVLAYPGSYHPPWIKNKQHSFDNNFYSTQTSLPTNILGFLHEKHSINDLPYLPHTDPTVPVSPTTVTATPGTMSISTLTPGLQQNIYTHPSTIASPHSVTCHSPVTHMPETIASQATTTIHQSLPPVYEFSMQQQPTSVMHPKRAVVWPSLCQQTPISYPPPDQITDVHPSSQFIVKKPPPSSQQPEDITVSRTVHPPPHVTHPKPHPYDAIYPRTLQTDSHPHPSQTVAHPPTVYLKPEQPLIHPPPLVVHSSPTIAHPQPIMLNSPPTVSHPPSTLLEFPASHIESPPTLIHLSTAICHPSPTIVDSPQTALQPPPALLDSSDLPSTVFYSPPTVIDSAQAAIHPPPTILNSPTALTQPSSTYRDLSPTSFEEQKSSLSSSQTVRHTLPDITPPNPNSKQPSSSDKPRSYSLV